MDIHQTVPSISDFNLFSTKLTCSLRSSLGAEVPVDGGGGGHGVPFPVQHGDVRRTVVLLHMAAAVVGRWVGGFREQGVDVVHEGLEI